jgi:hypothetical protein
MVECEECIEEFKVYCSSFYGPGGIWDMSATDEEIDKATKVRLLLKGVPFDGDSIDRELVRDIILIMRGDK